MILDGVTYIWKHIAKHPLVNATLAVLSQVFPITGVQVTAIATLLLVDTITGVMAAKARGEKITSEQGRAMTSRKIFGHMLLILSAAATAPLLETKILLTSTLGAVAGWELVSIFENAQTCGWVKNNPTDNAILSFLLGKRKELPQTEGDEKGEKKDDTNANRCDEAAPGGGDTGKGKDV